MQATSAAAAAAAVEEWQLCWECPPEAPYLRASFMLHHTFVNLLPGTRILLNQSTGIGHGRRLADHRLATGWRMATALLQPSKWLVRVSFDRSLAILARIGRTYSPEAQPKMELSFRVKEKPQIDCCTILQFT
jgi:hypothetical protein